MATSSYSNLFGTTGAGQQGSKAGIGTLFGQQPKPQMSEEERQQRQQPQQTFAQLQKQGMARPAPAAPQGQPFQQFGGSQQAQQARTGMMGALQQQLAQPTRFDTQAFQQIRQAQSAQLGAEYQAQQAQLNEELARRGLSASSIGGGRMGDLAGQQARALAQLDAQLLQQAAQTQAQDRLAALQAAQGFAELAGSQDLAQFEANRVAQAAQFQQALQQAQFGQQQTEFERGQALQAAQAQQAGQESAMERGLREALGMGELFLGERRQQAQETQFGQTQAQQQAEARSQQTGLAFRVDDKGQVVADVDPATGQQRTTLQAQQLRQQQQQFTTEQAQRQAETLSQQTGTVYEVGPNGLPVQKTLNGQPIRTESSLARLSQQQLQEAELSGSYKNADGTVVSTLAAQRLSQENLRALADQAAQRSQLTGQMHKVDDAGNVVLDTDAQGQPISTETRRAQMVQESNTARQQAQQQAEARTQQTGLSFIVGTDGKVVADIDPTTMQQRTTAQAQQFQAQLNQQKELAAAELTGTIMVDGQPVSTVAARRLGQEGLQLALQQATQLSQQTGNVYEVNADGQAVPKVGADGAPIRTESALARLSAEKLQQAELTGEYTDANGTKISTIAAKQLSQAQLNALADQAARQSQLTGNMYKVSVDKNGNPFVEQEFTTGADGKRVAVSTEARRAQEQQESNVTRQLNLARAEALSQQSGLSYKIDANGDVVPDMDASVSPPRQRTTVQAQQLAAQEDQARLDRELRERLGLGELTGMVGDQQTLAARQQQFAQGQAQQQLLIQLASALAQSTNIKEDDLTKMMKELYAKLGTGGNPLSNLGDTSNDAELERIRGRQAVPQGTPQTTPRGTPAPQTTTTTTTTGRSGRRGG
jgi:hypothetical protein